MLASDVHGDTVGSLSFSFASDIVELVILTTDDAFLKTLRQAVGGARRLWHVPSPDKVSDLLVAGQVGIVVLDAHALHEAPGSFISQIKRQFPDLVVLVAGKRDDETALAGLITVGTVYRFIHKPLSPARARLFADAAVKKYEEQRRLTTPPPRPVNAAPRKPRLVGMAALGGLAVLAAALALTWSLRHHQARVQARVPPPDNAPGLPLARPPGGLDDVRERLLSRAENALLEERLDEAATAIDAARKAGVDDGRLAFLTSQLAKARRQSRAAAALRSKSDPRSGAHEDERVTELLDLAAERTRQGRLIEPDGDNAKFYVQEAQRIGPDNAAALAAEEGLALALLAEARSAIEHRDFAHAVSLLDAAQGVASQANIDNLLQLLRTARRQVSD